MAEIRTSGAWQRVERGLSDMANLMGRGDYNLSLVKGRQTMEQIVRLCAGQNLVVYTDLADTIEKLYENGGISKTTRDSFHTIRILGNKAVHEGDNSAQDASRAYQLLEHEIAAYGSGAAGTQRGAERSSAARDGAQPGTRSAQKNLQTFPERERVPLNRAQQEKRRVRYDQADEREQRDRRQVPNREDRLRAKQRSAQKRSGQRGGRNQKRPQRSSLNLYDVLRILIPLICILLLVVLIRGCVRGGDTAQTSTAAQTETQLATEPVTTAPPETEPETTAPAVVRYKIRGNSVNVRYADNENRVYTQLADGTEIGEVEEVSGTDKVKFVLDGVEVTVNKNYIVPVEGSVTETGAQ